MLPYLVKIARTPYLTSHGPDANTVVTTPASVPQGVPSQLTASITFAWSNNAFSQNVGATEYYIDTPPWAGGTAIPMNGTFNSPTVAVEATINTASLSVGRHVIFVQGRGVNRTGGNIRNVWRNHHIEMAVAFPSSTWACASGSARAQEGWR